MARRHLVHLTFNDSLLIYTYQLNSVLFMNHWRCTAWTCNPCKERLQFERGLVTKHHWSWITISSVQIPPCKLISRSYYNLTEEADKRTCWVVLTKLVNFLRPYWKKINFLHNIWFKSVPVRHTHYTQSLIKTIYHPKYSGGCPFF